MVAAINHEEDIHVPSADDVIHAGDTLICIGRHGQEARLRAAFID